MCSDDERVRNPHAIDERHREGSDDRDLARLDLCCVAGVGDGDAVAAPQDRVGLPEFLPTEADKTIIMSLMKQVIEPGKIASWIAPPERGINRLPVDYEYVRVG